jgi:hypothetical protein
MYKNRITTKLDQIKKAVNQALGRALAPSMSARFYVFVLKL